MGTKKGKTNKTQKVLQHLLSGRPITSMEAFDLYGATRLSAIIFNLRQRGYNITTIDRQMTDRYGNTATYAEYRMV